jgi:8-oxo-dGTP pyrophosphatase MutT (NUDIX family)
VRALVVRPDDAVLLVRFEFPDRALWTAPGGGVEPGEEPLDALRRELDEEVGLVGFDAVPVWTRTYLGPMPRGGFHDGQAETYFLVRVDRDFEPAPRLSEEQLRAEHMTATRWWTTDELATCEEDLVPGRLRELLPALLRDGPPATPHDVGL